MDDRLARPRRPGPSRRLFRRAVFVAIAAVGAWGCALVVGVDFDAARLATESDGAVSPRGREAGGGGGGGCGPNEKSCNGACVSKANPEYGCGSADCTACSLALSTGSVCGPTGACAPKGCAKGFDDCDKDPANGCEADLARPETCGSCGTKCPAGTFCSPGGCVAQCPGNLVPCNGACVDTQSSIAHCGGCNKACAGGPNADPACVGGACQLACRPGFADCKTTPPKTCEPLPKWFVDGDGDDAGTAVFVTSCTRPAGHAPASGDCNDTNPNVHPGAAPLDVPFVGANGPSFDYDCDGTEVEESPPTEKFPGSCGVGCNLTGTNPLPPRLGAGVNDFCGSPLKTVCINFSGCQPITFDSGVRIKCN